MPLNQIGNHGTLCQCSYFLANISKIILFLLIIFYLVGEIKMYEDQKQIIVEYYEINFLLYLFKSNLSGHFYIKNLILKKKK